MTNTVQRTRRGSIPETWAALSLLPTATIWRPNIVDLSRNSKATTSVSATRIDAETPLPPQGTANVWIVAPI